MTTMNRFFATFALMVLTLSMVSPEASQAEPTSPYATLIVNRDDASGAVTLSLSTAGRPGGDVSLERTIADGVAVWDKFDKWYEELFGLTYLSDDYSRLWKQLRARGTSLGAAYIDKEMLDAISSVKLLVVVDKIRPFPADAFRFGDKWLFEIAPIVHSTTPGPKDVGDNHVYKKALVLDCQGPKDREGLEAPGVDAALSKIPNAERKLIVSLTADETVANLEANQADILHLATHAHPDEFFPGRQKPGVSAEKLSKLKLPYRTILSTGCHTGNPIFAGAALHGDTHFVIASMYTTSGKDGIKIAETFYKSLFDGKTPFESFYDMKKKISGPKPDFPDILRFVFFVR